MRGTVHSALPQVATPVRLPPVQFEEVFALPKEFVHVTIKSERMERELSIHVALSLSQKKNFW